MNEQQRKAVLQWLGFYGGGGATLQSVIVQQVNPNLIPLQFSEAVNIVAGNITLNTDGPNALSVSSVNDSGTSTPDIVPSREILPGENVTVSISGATTVSGNDLADITDLAVTNNVLYWAEDFDGTVIDTDRFTVSNPNSADLLISQDAELRFTRVTDNAVTSGLTNKVESNLLFPYGVFSGYWDRVTGFANSSPVWRWNVDASNFLGVNGVTGDVNARIEKSGGGIEYNQASGQSTDGIRWKIIVTPTTVTFKYWDGDSWETMLNTTAQSINIGAAAKFFMSSSSSIADAINDRFAMRQIRYAPTDWDTELPEDFFFNVGWILDGGIWNDTNQWDDTKNWID